MVGLTASAVRLQGAIRTLLIAGVLSPLSRRKCRKAVLLREDDPIMPMFRSSFRRGALPETRVARGDVSNTLRGANIKDLFKCHR